MGSVRFQVVEQDGQEIVEEIHKVVVHQFQLSDVDDPDIYAAGPIFDWEKSDAGKFVMQNAKSVPVFHKHVNYSTYGYQYYITAEIEYKKLSEFYLRWGNPNGSNTLR